MTTFLMFLQMWSRILSPRVISRTGVYWKSLYTMQLKTSEFQSLFNDGLNGLAGDMLLGPDISIMFHNFSP